MIHIKQKSMSLNEQIDIIQKQLQEKNKALGEQIKRVQTVDLERNKAKSSYTALKENGRQFRVVQRRRSGRNEKKQASI